MDESIKTIAELLEVLKETPRKAYDFISMNNHMLDRWELTNIIKELLYAINSFCPESQAAAMMLMVADELEYIYKEDLGNK